MDWHYEAGDYTIGWICAIPLEGRAAVAVLEKRHPQQTQPDGDDNAYEFGQIGSYNIIIAWLPSGIYGITEAAKVATRLRASFPSINAGLMVGVGGGAPQLPRNDIRLGDVVVSKPGPSHGGVIQYDHGKAMEHGEFVRTGFLNKPSPLLLKALAKLQSLYSEDNNPISGNISELLRNGLLPKEYARPPCESDQLFQFTYEHPPENASCRECNDNFVVRRTLRDQTEHEPRIHYGLIASANQVMKNGGRRNQLSKDMGILCFEMEAAGLMDELPSLVIRGICDYSDSHKNKVWQPYAALAAAVFAKQLILQLPVRVSNRPQLSKIELDIPIAEGALFGSYADQDEPECLEGTRVDLLDEINKWSLDIGSDVKPIFWLVGLAGTGKSTISRTVARRLEAQGCLGASFYFKRTEAERASGASLFPTLAVQLARYFYEMASAIQNVIQADSSILKKALKEQFDKLISRPLSKIKATNRPNMVILVDALDECGRREDISTIIQLLNQLKEIKGVGLKILLTSRPEMPLQLGFKKVSQGTYEKFVLQEVPNVESDILLFLKNELVDIRETHDLPDDWPGEETIVKLAVMSSPLFIYAKTVCRFIGDEYFDPEERLATVLQSHNNWQSSKFDQTYLPVLNQLVVGRSGREKDRLVDEFKEVVGTIISLANPLPLQALAHLLSLSTPTIERRLKPLSSVIDVPADSQRSIYLFHQSFRDFLLDSDSQENKQFRINEKETHSRILNKCLELMSGPNGLKKNICRLKSPGIKKSEIDRKIIEKHISTELRYACLFWIRHLDESGISPLDDGPVHSFLKTHLLHWLEATGLLDSGSYVVRMIDALDFIGLLRSHVGQRSRRTNNGPVEFSHLVKDIKRFVLRYQSIIFHFPLQVYFAALTFAPEQSLVKSLYNSAKYASWVKKLSMVEGDWGRVIQTLEGHRINVRALDYSSDDKLIVSGSSDDTISIWNAGSGAHMQKLQHDNGYPLEIVFSPDSRLLAFLSGTGCFALWDWSPGIILKTFNFQRETLTMVVVSAEKDVLAFGTRDHITGTWRDIISGEIIELLGDFPRSANFVTFYAYKQSAILRYLSYDDFGCLWLTREASIHELLRSINGGPVALSQEMNKVALISGKDIILYDLDMQAVSHRLRDFRLVNTRIDALAFCPSGVFFASAHSSTSSSGRSVINLWSTIDTSRRSTLEGHRSSIATLKFNLIGDVLASGSYDRSIILWNAENFGRRNNDIAALDTVSNQKRWSASASAADAKTFLAWDAAFKSQVPKESLYGHSKPIYQMIFSPNGGLLVSASEDGTVRLVEACNGTILQIYQIGGEPSKRSNPISFSDDSSTIIIGKESFACPQTNQNLSRTSDGSDNFGSVLNVWIHAKNGKRLLWLPHDRRGSLTGSFACYGNMVALSDNSGRVALFKFDFDALRTEFPDWDRD